MPLLENKKVSWLLGYLVCWLQGFMVSWFLGFLVFNFLVSWFLGFLVSWCLVSWFLGLWVSWFLFFLVSWFLGSWFRRFWVSWFQCFRDLPNSNCMLFNKYWSHIQDFRDLIKRIFIIVRRPSFPKLTNMQFDIWGFIKIICFQKALRFS